MKLVVEKTEKLEGEITIPSSKSHTIRAVIIASLAEGTSKILNPLKSDLLFLIIIDLKLQD